SCRTSPGPSGTNAFAFSASRRITRPARLLDVQPLEERIEDPDRRRRLRSGARDVGLGEERAVLVVVDGGLLAEVRLALGRLRDLVDDAPGADLDVGEERDRARVAAEVDGELAARG